MIKPVDEKRERYRTLRMTSLGLVHPLSFPVSFTPITLVDNNIRLRLLNGLKQYVQVAEQLFRIRIQNPDPFLFQPNHTVNWSKQSEKTLLYILNCFLKGTITSSEGTGNQYTFGNQFDFRSTVPCCTIYVWIFFTEL
jgi:hypothetical protein